MEKTTLKRNIEEADIKKTIRDSKKKDINTFINSIYLDKI
jgi:hypothetical protein